MTGKAVTANGQGRADAPVGHSAWIRRVGAIAALTVVAVWCCHEALRQRVAERWIELSEGIRYVMLPETSRAVDNQLEAAFAPVYAAIEPFVALLDGDTALDLTLPARTERVIRRELIGGLEERFNHA